MTTRPGSTAPVRLGGRRPHAEQRAAGIARSAWALLGLLVVASAALRTAAATGVAAPWIVPDEPLYGLVGRTLLGEHTVISGALPRISLLTPLVAGLPSLLLDDVRGALLAAQALQALLMSSVAVVVFAWARPLAGAGRALAAAALSLTVPGMAYSGLLMTEALFYPASALALWLLARLVERPTPLRHVLFLTATVVSVLVRAQALALLPAAVVALVVAAAASRRRDLLRAAAPHAALCAALGIAGAILVASGREALGAYTATVTRGYGAGAIAQDVWWHAGGLFLLTAGVPLVALGALLPCLRRSARPSDPLVALLVVALVWAACVVVQVGIFASRFVGHLAERDLLSTVPPLLVVLTVWWARGAPSQAWTATVALLVAVLAILLPIERFATNAAMLDSFSSIALRKLAEHTSTGTLEIVWPALAATLAAAPVLLHHRLRAVAAGVCALVLLVLSGFAQTEVRRASTADVRWWFADASPTWIDERADGAVTWVQAGSRYWGGAWKSAFWNRRLDRVVRFPDTGNPGPIPAPLTAPRFDGTLLTTDGDRVPGPFAVVPLGMMLAGAEVGRIAPSGDLPGVALWRTEGDVRLRFWVQGLQPNGDLRGTAHVQVWACGTRHLELTLLGKEATLVAFDVAGFRRSSTPIGPGQVKVAAVRLPGGGGRCDVTVSSRALVGITRIDLVG